MLGIVGKGKVLATGIAMGLTPDNTDAPSTPGEFALLRPSVRWLGE